MDFCQLLVATPVGTMPFVKTHQFAAGGDALLRNVVLSKPSGNCAYPKREKNDMKKSNSFFIILM